MTFSNETKIKAFSELLELASNNITYDIKTKETLIELSVKTHWDSMLWSKRISEYNKTLPRYSPKHIKLGALTRVTYRMSELKLNVSKGNTKIKKQAKDFNMRVRVFDLLSGVTCPAAVACQRRVELQNNDITERKIKDDSTLYKCFATKAESQYVYTYMNRLINTILIKHATQNEIIAALYVEFKKYDMIRLHSAGDFFTKKYFNAVLEVANMLPNTIFYAYTKMLPYVIAKKPINFGIIYSRGGIFDKQAKEKNVPHAIVAVGDYDKRLPFACESLEDDFKYILRGESFLLHLH